MLSYGEIVSIVLESSRIQTEHIIERRLERLLSRNLLERKPIKIITGIRRSGKSFILKRLYHKIANLIPHANILFLNFENDRLISNLNLSSLREIYESFKQKSDPEYRFYVFLDEIQNISNWERFVRTIYDSTDDEIYLTGSNSELLSSELSTAIGGRVLDYHLQPFTFPEYILYHSGQVDEFSYHEKKNELLRLFDTYIDNGGICETINLIPEQIDIYRESLLDKIIFKDIITRYAIKKPELIKNLFYYIAKNPGSLVNNKKLGQEMDVDDKTVQTYINYLKNTYLIQRIDKFNWKTRKIFNTQKKYYLSDNLFTNLCKETRKLENLVYSHLIEEYSPSSIYFIRDEKGHEIDFLVNKGAQFVCIQVCQELNEENKTREFRSLTNLMKYRTEQELQGDSFILLYLKDYRYVKNNPPGITVRGLPEFLLFK